MLEVMILFTLKKYDCSIYRINKIIEDTFSAYAKPSLGAVNPSIKKLQNLGCITSEASISEGGKRIKTISLTQFGEKYLKSLLLSFEFSNPATFLNTAGILLCASDILNNDEKEKFFLNLLNQIIMYKKFVKDKMDKNYNITSELQEKAMNATLEYAKQLEELCK